MAVQKHICGLCQKEFTSEKQYADHLCEETGHTPKDVDHFGEEFTRVSEAALARGAAAANQDE